MTRQKDEARVAPPLEGAEAERVAPAFDGDPVIAMHGELAPEFKKQQLVPKGQVPVTASVALQVVGMLGGAMLGAYLSGFTAPHVDTATMRAIAQRCVDDVEHCTVLQLAGGEGTWLLVCGLLLLGLDVLGKVPWARLAKKPKAD